MNLVTLKCAIASDDAYSDNKLTIRGLDKDVTLHSFQLKDKEDTICSFSPSTSVVVLQYVANATNVASMVPAKEIPLATHVLDLQNIREGDTIASDGKYPDLISITVARLDHAGIGKLDRGANLESVMQEAVSNFASSTIALIRGRETLSGSLMVMPNFTYGNMVLSPSMYAIHRPRGGISEEFIDKLASYTAALHDCEKPPIDANDNEIAVFIAQCASSMAGTMPYMPDLAPTVGKQDELTERFGFMELHGSGDCEDSGRLAYRLVRAIQTGSFTERSLAYAMQQVASKYVACMCVATVTSASASDYSASGVSGHLHALMISKSRFAGLLAMDSHPLDATLAAQTMESSEFNKPFMDSDVHPVLMLEGTSPIYPLPIDRSDPHIPEGILERRQDGGREAIRVLSMVTGIAPAIIGYAAKGRACFGLSGQRAFYNTHTSVFTDQFLASGRRVTGFCLMTKRLFGKASIGAKTSGLFGEGFAAGMVFLRAYYGAPSDSAIVDTSRILPQLPSFDEVGSLTPLGSSAEKFRLDFNGDDTKIGVIACASLAAAKLDEALIRHRVPGGLFRAVNHMGVFPSVTMFAVARRTFPVASDTYVIYGINVVRLFTGSIEGDIGASVTHAVPEHTNLPVADYIEVCKETPVVETDAVVTVDVVDAGDAGDTVDAEPCQTRPAVINTPDSSHVECPACPACPVCEEGPSLDPATEPTPHSGKYHAVVPSDEQYIKTKLSGDITYFEVDAPFDSEQQSVICKLLDEIDADRTRAIVNVVNHNAHEQGIEQFAAGSTDITEEIVSTEIATGANPYSIRDLLLSVAGPSDMRIDRLARVDMHSSTYDPTAGEWSSWLNEKLGVSTQAGFIGYHRETSLGSNLMWIVRSPDDGPAMHVFQLPYARQDSNVVSHMSVVFMAPYSRYLQEQTGQTLALEQHGDAIDEPMAIARMLDVVLSLAAMGFVKTCTGRKHGGPKFTFSHFHALDMFDPMSPGAHTFSTLQVSKLQFVDGVPYEHHASAMDLPRRLVAEPVAYAVLGDPMGCDCPEDDHGLELTAALPYCVLAPGPYRELAYRIFKEPSVTAKFADVAATETPRDARDVYHSIVELVFSHIFAGSTHCAKVGLSKKLSLCVPGLGGPNGAVDDASLAKLFSDNLFSQPR